MPLRNKIIIIGNHAGTGLGLAKAAKYAYPDLNIILLFSKPPATNMTSIEWEDEQIDIQTKSYHFKPIDNLPWYKKLYARAINFLVALSYIPLLLSAKTIISLTGTLLDSKVWNFLFIILKNKPYYAVATGSDIREEARRNKRLFRYFKEAEKVLALNIDMLSLKDELSFKHMEFFPFAIDTNKYNKRTISSDSSPMIRFFMPSHLDWGQANSEPGRNSFKGNDKFIKGFARAVHAGLKVHLTLLDRGSDREHAKALIEELQIKDHVSFLPEMRRKSLIDQYNNCDVVVDQFSIGSFGTIGLEAMACFKPVMIYLNKEAIIECYKDDPPPVFNVCNEDEIFEAIMQISNEKTHLNEIASRSREWVVHNHSLETVGLKLKSL